MPAPMGRKQALPRPASRSSEGMQGALPISTSGISAIVARMQIHGYKAIALDLQRRINDREELGQQISVSTACRSSTAFGP